MKIVPPGALTAAIDNVLAANLGRVCLAAASDEHAAGDIIDRGLILRRLLEEEGFYLVKAEVP